MSLSKRTCAEAQWKTPDTLAVAMNTRSRKRNQQLPDNALPEINFYEPNRNRGHSLTQPIFRDPFIQIANQLDPSSIAKFVRTCRAIYNICVNTDAIKVTVDNFSLWDRGNGLELVDGRICGCCSQGVDPDSIRTKIFDIRLNYINFLFTKITAEGLRCARRFIERNNVKFVRQFYIGKTVEVPLSHLMDFLKATKPKSVNAGVSVLPPGMLMWMVTNMNAFTYFHSTSEQLILSSTASSLNLSQTRLSEKAVRTILQEWISGKRKFVGLAFGDFDKNTLSTIFEDYNCFNVNYNGPILKSRPVVFKEEGDDVVFYVLRNDYEVLCVRTIGWLRKIHFDICDNRKIPDAVKANLEAL